MTEETKTMEKEYNKLTGKYSIPSFTEMNNLFEISSLEVNDFSLRVIRRQLLTHIDALLSELEKIIQPDSTINDMYDSRSIDDGEKEDIFMLIKTLVVFKKRSLLCEISHNNEEDVKLINDIFNNYQETTTKVKAIITKLIDAWNTKSAKEEIAGYFG